VKRKESPPMIRAIASAPPPVAGVEVDFPQVSDEEKAENLRVLAAHVKNADWLENEWPRLLPQALGRHVAVAGQQAFIANSAREALDLATAAHPDDPGSFVQFVPPVRRPRVYAHHGKMGNG
jgi:hypothetical protein